MPEVCPPAGGVLARAHGEASGQYGRRLSTTTQGTVRFHRPPLTNRVATSMRSRCALAGRREARERVSATRPTMAPPSARSGGGLRHNAGEVIVNLDALVTAREAQDYPPMRKAGVCRHTIAWWRTTTRVEPAGQRGRSPLFRWGDLLRAERDTRLSGQSRRSTRCRSCERAAERERLAA